VWVALTGLAVVAFAAAWLYNALVRLRVLSDNAWSDIDVQLKRRHDLIPGVVEVVKGHASYERSTLEGVVSARTRAMAAEGPRARGVEEGGLSAALRQLFALAEAYPDLRATASFAALQRTLSDIEEAIQQARRYYNAVVRDYNTKAEQYPSNLVAALLGFGRREFFQLDAAAEADVPDVSFDRGAGTA